MVDRCVVSRYALSNRGPAGFRKEIGYLQRIIANSS